MALNFTKRIEFISLESYGPEPGGTEVSQGFAWADIRTLKGNEVAVFNSTALEGSSRFIIRYRKGIKKSWRIKYKGQLYKIESITNDDERNRTITIVANTFLDYDIEV